MLRFLQILHVAMLFGVALFHAIFIQVSESHDRYRHILDAVISVVAAGWVASVFICTVIYGEEGNLKDKLLKSYRRLLQLPIFLYLSDLLLLAVFGLLALQFLAFRQVEFYSPADCELLVNDNAGDVLTLGVIKANSLEKFRLGVGTRRLVFVDPATSEPWQSIQLVVPAVWKQAELPRVNIPKPPRGTYEKTH